MYKNKSVSLVLPAYNEEKNLAPALRDFISINLFDEIIVVDNNSYDRTAKIAKRMKVKVINEKKQGYGYALKKGMAEARGDYIMLSEPDGTFRARDAFRLMRFTRDYDVVIGSRTNRIFIGKNANMRFFLRNGNYYLAKLIQLLYKTSSISDCGCTYRVFRKKVINEILPNLRVGGSHFLPETVINTTLLGYKIYELPVHYRKRVGDSKITGSLLGSIKVGFNMLKLAFLLKFRYPLPN